MKIAETMSAYLKKISYFAVVAAFKCCTSKRKKGCFYGKTLSESGIRDVYGCMAVDRGGQGKPVATLAQAQV